MAKLTKAQKDSLLSVLSLVASAKAYAADFREGMMERTVRLLAEAEKQLNKQIAA